MFRNRSTAMFLLPSLAILGCNQGDLSHQRMERSPPSDDKPGLQVPTPLPAPLSFYYAQPVLNGAGLIEPMAPTLQDEERTHLINLDIKVENTSPDTIVLQTLTIDYAGPDAPSSRSFFGPELAPPTSDSNTYLWGGGWNRIGAFWEDPQEYGQGHWRDATMEGNRLLTAGVSYPDGSPAFTIARHKADGGLSATRLGFESADLGIATSMDLHEGALYVAGGASFGSNDAFVMTKVDPDTLEPVADFGILLGSGVRSGEKAFIFPDCQMGRAEAIDVFTHRGQFNPDAFGTDNSTTPEETYIYVAGEADCGDGDELLVARFHANGDIDGSFGGTGYVTFGTWPGADVSFGGMAVQDVEGGQVVLAGNVGTNCHYSANTAAGWCEAAVTRYDWDGNRDLSFGVGGTGWATPQFTDNPREAVEALVVDSKQNIYLGGYTAYPREDVVSQAWALARLKKGGEIDLSWGADNQGGGGIGDICANDCYDGIVIHHPGDRTGSILDLTLDSLENPRAAGFVRLASGEWDFGVTTYGNVGSPIWSASAYNHVDSGLGSATAFGIAIDASDRTLLAGSSPGAFLGSARFWEDGLLDTVLVVKPGQLRGIHFPDGRHLDTAPTAFTMTLEDGFGRPDSVFTLPLEVHEVDMEGSYVLPFEADALEGDEYIWVSQHHELGSAHRGDIGQRHAYDLGITRWTGGGFSSVHEGTDGSDNEDYLIWGKPMRAMADGIILECFRTVEDNPAPGEATPDAPGGGNSLLVLNDSGEYMLYAHLKEDTIPEHLCPEEGEQSEIVPIVTNEYIGDAGNSGRSSGPHFHVHVSMGHHRLVPGTLSEGIPLLFQDYILLSTAQDPEADDEWAEGLNESFPPGVLVRPL